MNNIHKDIVTINYELKLHLNLHLQFYILSLCTQFCMHNHFCLYKYQHKIIHFYLFFQVKVYTKLST